MTRQEKLELLALLEERRRRNARDDLSAFCRYIEVPGAPIEPDNPDCEEFYKDRVEPAAHHLILNDALMRLERGDTRRLMVFMPPGSAKSTYGSVTFPTWYMGRKPGRNVICTSYGSTLAARFGRKCRQITRSKEYREVFDTELVADNRAADDWAMTNGSTYMSAGILAGLTGNRADGLVIDDPVKSQEEADSTTIQNKLWDEYRTSLRTRVKPGGFIMIIQTRWNENDLSGRILPKDWNGQSGRIIARDGEEWEVLCIQAECEMPDDPLGRQPGEWLWPEWFPPAHWAQEKRTQGSRNWSALFQQRPAPSEGGIFKRHWPRRYVGKPEHEGNIILSIDTGNKPGELNDPSVVGTWLWTRKGYYLLDVWRDRVDFPSLKRMVKNIASVKKPMGIIIEDKASGTQLIQELRADREFSHPVIPFDPTPHGDKVMRANNISPIVEAGLLYLPETAPWLIDFEGELFAFPISGTKDQVDMLSQFLKWGHSSMVEFEAYGSGTTRAGVGGYGNDERQSQIDESTGFGRVTSQTNTSGF